MRLFVLLLFVVYSNELLAQNVNLSGKVGSRYNDIVHLKKTDQYEEALHLVNKTLKKYKKHPDFLNLKAMVILSKGAINDKTNDSIAISLLDQAIAIAPKRAAFYNNRGWLYQLLGKYDKAKKDFEHAVALESNNLLYRQNPIRILFIQKKVPQVLKLCNQAILDFPKDGYAYFVRGNVLREYVKKEKLGNQDLKKAHELGWKKGFHFEY